jgi:FkbM family methyltransferase
MRLLFHSAKQRLERATGVRIFRHTLPHGCDLFRDLDRVPNWAEPRVIVDIGAHVGSTVARFRAAYPWATIHAFEPAGANRRALVENFGSDARVEIHAVALSSTNGVATLHLAEHSTMNSLAPREAAIGTERVPTVTLDSFCAERGIRDVQFCKVDTEGFDLEVLRGATGLLEQQRIDFVQVETSFRRDTKYFAPIWEIDRLMTEKRYEIFGLYEQQTCWTGRNSLLFANAVYVRTTLIDDLPPW